MPPPTATIEERIAGLIPDLKLEIMLRLPYRQVCFVDEFDVYFWKRYCEQWQIDAGPDASWKTRAYLRSTGVCHIESIRLAHPDDPSTMWRWYHIRALPTKRPTPVILRNLLVFKAATRQSLGEEVPLVEMRDILHRYYRTTYSLPVQTTRAVYDVLGRFPLQLLDFVPIDDDQFWCTYCKMRETQADDADFDMLDLFWAFTPKTVTDNVFN